MGNSDCPVIIRSEYKRGAVGLEKARANHGIHRVLEEADRTRLLLKLRLNSSPSSGKMQFSLAKPQHVIDGRLWD
jgi:hypothetical protein